MKKLTMLVCGLMLVSLFVFPGNPNPMDSEAKYYEDARVIRIKYSQGETYVKRSYEEGFEEAAVNLPVFDKDTVGTTEGRIELYLGSLNYLRLDFDTEIEFEKAPALRTTGMVVRINKGGIYLNIDTLEYEKDIEIQTPGCGVFLLDKGAYRIDVHESGKTDVFVFEGAAEVAGDNESKNLIAGQKIVMLNGAIKEHPFYFYASNRDDFDEWNDLRNKEVGFARYSSANYLEDGYEDCEYELSRNGRWKYETTYQTYIWIPYNVGAYWTPYYSGRWIWNPFYGHVWHSYDPWGWYCHHYGRWHWSYYDGWCWVPGYSWSPAWVHWYGHGHYYGWCPMSHYNRPIVVINKRWLKNYDDRKGIPSDSSSLVVVKKNQLAAANIQKVALKKGELTSDSAIFKGATNVERPVVSRIGVIDSKGNRVVYKEGGIASTDKYKTISSQSGSSSAQGAVYKYNGSKNADIDSHKYSDSTVTKEKVFKSSDTPVTRSKTDTTTGAGTDVKVFKSGEPAAKTGSDTTDSSARERKIYKSGDTVIKSKTYKSDAETAGRYESRTVSKKSSSSKSESSSGSQSGSTGSVKVY
ncbi:MAG: hypothetical protein L0Y73_01740, partial [Candidatus Aminicenantes bacterium]|nr:hypothetical protein [Candidatus Aminicenantes bacterium]